MDTQNHLLKVNVLAPDRDVSHLTSREAKLFIKQVAFVSTLPSLIIGIQMLTEYDPSAGISLCRSVD